MTASIDLSSFGAAWDERWPGCMPVGHDLRHCASGTWVRFHSLPGSKADADNDAEQEELLRRHTTLLAELSQLAMTDPAELLVITLAWSETADPVERDELLTAAFPQATYWRTEPYDLSDPRDPTWVHLYVTCTAVDDDNLRSLLLVVADDATSGVVVCPPDARWLYHPYVAGGDVIAPTVGARDVLKARHSAWLPDNEWGL